MKKDTTKNSNKKAEYKYDEHKYNCCALCENMRYVINKNGIMLDLYCDIVESNVVQFGVCIHFNKITDYED